VKIGMVDRREAEVDFGEARTNRQCPRCKEYEVDEEGYCNRCRRNTLPPL